MGSDELEGSLVTQQVVSVGLQHLMALRSQELRRGEDVHDPLQQNAVDDVRHRDEHTRIARARGAVHANRSLDAELRLRLVDLLDEVGEALQVLAVFRPVHELEVPQSPRLSGLKQPEL